VRPDGSCRPWNEEPANWNKDWTKLIDPGEFVPFGTADEVFAALQTLASGAGGAAFQSAIRQLAAYYDVRPWVLESALVPALGKPVTVVDSSPMGGVASFIWSQDPDRVAIVTALERGGLVSWLGDPRAIDGHRLRP
jgi:hypothetical protein